MVIVRIIRYNLRHYRTLVSRHIFNSGNLYLRLCRIYNKMVCYIWIHWIVSGRNSTVTMVNTRIRSFCWMANCD